MLNTSLGHLKRHHQSLGAVWEAWPDRLASARNKKDIDRRRMDKIEDKAAEKMLNKRNIWNVIIRLLIRIPVLIVESVFPESRFLPGPTQGILVGRIPSVRLPRRLNGIAESPAAPADGVDRVDLAPPISAPRTRWVRRTPKLKRRPF